MLDTERLDIQHFRRAAADFGFSALESLYFQSVGRNRQDTRELFRAALGEQFPVDGLCERWRQYSSDHAEQFGVPLKPGLLDILGRLDRLGLPKAVATSTSRNKALALLTRTELLPRFDAVAAGDEVFNGKPHPEIFHLAAARLRVEARNCIVLEDSPAGIHGAHAAGMIPVLVPDVITPSDETIQIAYRVFRSLSEALTLFADGEGSGNPG